ncbi:MAG: hypothetical protein ABIJ59_01120 [Pseudomonadota bacterium]
MSAFSDQIAELIDDTLEYQDGTLFAQIKFNENFIGFNGHFPGNPVLPGVVMIKVMTQMFARYKKKEYRLSQIKKAKFIEPIFADNIALFFVKPDENEGEIKLQGKILKSDKIIAKISLVLQAK